MEASPTTISGQPARKISTAPSGSVAANTTMKARRMVSGRISPAWVARVGPSRSSVSAPLTKSK